jgi:hypothetical protein
MVEDAVDDGITAAEYMIEGEEDVVIERSRGEGDEAKKSCVYIQVKHHKANLTLAASGNVSAEFVKSCGPDSLLRKDHGVQTKQWVLWTTQEITKQRKRPKADVLLKWLCKPASERRPVRETVTGFLDELTKKEPEHCLLGLLRDDRVARKLFEGAWVYCQETNGAANQ